MTGIGGAGKSHVGGSGADTTSESSSSRSETRLAPREGSQSFDSVVERMRSRPQDRTAPLVSQPPISGVAVPRGDEIKAAKRKMRRLFEELDARRNAAMQAQNSTEEAQERIDQLIGAVSTVLDYYASLPPQVARSILSDDQVRRLRDEAVNAAGQCNNLASATIYELEARRKGAAGVLDKLRADKASPDQLNRAASSVAKHYVACMEWWGKKAWRMERMQSVCAATANLPSATPEMRKAEAAALRHSTGWALNTKVMYLHSRIALAQLKIESQASTVGPAVRHILMGEDGRVHLLGTFIKDTLPAFVSTKDAVMNSKGQALDAEHCAVLEGVMERLSEFASEVHGIVTGLRDAGKGSELPLELLDQIVEGAWGTAHEVTQLLAAQPKTPAMIELPARAAILENSPVMAEGHAARRKGKGKRTPAAGEGSSTAGLPESKLAKRDADTAPTAKIIVLSDLGTKKLASAEEAHARASASAVGHLEMWQAPPSREALTGLLERLDELLQFDLPAQQSAVSQARQMKPENADHVVDLVVKRLQKQSAEIEACVAALEDPRRRVLLTPVQVREVHDKTVRLKAMLSQAQGQANSLNARKTAIMIDCMKTYAFPSQKYLEQLRAAEELAPVDRPRALKSEPGTLFEIRLQPKALRNGATPSPMWVHIHTNRPVYAGQLATLDDADFAACHVKSNEQRGHNRQWQNARAAMGHENVVIHRGKLTPTFCKSLLSISARYPLPEAEHASIQFARLGM
ncbi:hypothetical protein [Microvirga lotononidis]|nr:hypothetical protein [Microvirga lotononidis]WQO30167.1 hypothetical protein U0023_27940 [Microvirga lotononidis]